jgi:hypothetical protein
MYLGAHVRFEGSDGAEQDRLVGNDVVRGAGMERADGDNAEFFSRLMTLCTSTTKRDAIITGSMVACDHGEKATRLFLLVVAALAFPMFWLLDTKDPLTITLAIIGAIIFGQIVGFGVGAP